MQDLEPVSYKSNMAIVQQEPALFSWTIEENLVYGLDFEPTVEDLDEACRQANALDFIKDESIFP